MIGSNVPQSSEQGPLYNQTMVTHDFITKVLNQTSLEFKNPVVPTSDSDREIIAKFTEALTGKKYKEKTATAFENRIFDVLLLAEAFNELDKEEVQERVAKLKELGPENCFSTLLAACLLTELLHEDKHHLEQARNFFAGEVHTLLREHPELPKLVENKKLSVTLKKPKPQLEKKLRDERIEEIKNRTSLKTLSQEKSRMLALFFGTLFIGTAAASQIPASANLTDPGLPEDICQGPDVSFCHGNLGIPRNQMPQLEGEVITRFENYWKGKNVTVTHEEVKAAGLTPSQGELLRSKVRGMAGAIGAGVPICKESIMVSKDNYVLDGHHRWAACKIMNEGISIRRIDVNILDLITAANSFEGVTRQALQTNLYAEQQATAIHKIPPLV